VVYSILIFFSTQGGTAVLASVGIPEKRKQFYSKKMAHCYAHSHALEAQSKN